MLRQGEGLVLVHQLQKALVQKQPGPRLAAPIQDSKQQFPGHGPARGVVGGAEHQKVRVGAHGVQNIRAQQKAVLPLKGVEGRLAARRHESALVVREGGHREQRLLRLQGRGELVDQLRCPVAADDVLPRHPVHRRQLLPQGAAAGVGIGGEALCRRPDRRPHRLRGAEGVHVGGKVQADGAGIDVAPVDVTLVEDHSSAPPSSRIIP